MTIEMVKITPEYLPKDSGVYLVKTHSNLSKSFPTFTKERFVQANVTKHLNNKNVWEYTIDVKNQTPIEISSEPII